MQFINLYIETTIIYTMTKETLNSVHNSYCSTLEELRFYNDISKICLRLDLEGLDLGHQEYHY